MTRILHVDRLLELYCYDAVSGKISNKSNGRVILPSPDELVVYCYDPVDRSRKKFLYHNLAYILGSELDIPEGFKVLSLNLNEEDIRYNNLKLISKPDYTLVRCALRNLLGGLAITQHKTDKLAYRVNWYQFSKRRCIVCYDIARAQAILNRKSLDFSKTVNAYIRSI